MKKSSSFRNYVAMVAAEAGHASHGGGGGNPSAEKPSHGGGGDHRGWVTTVAKGLTTKALQAANCQLCAKQFADKGGCASFVNGDDPEPMIPEGCDECGHEALKYCRQHKAKDMRKVAQEMDAVLPKQLGGQQGHQQGHQQEHGGQGHQQQGHQQGHQQEHGGQQGHQQQGQEQQR